jgi:putative phage-type endonuclease
VIHDCEQRSATWHNLRLGKLTASAIADMLARTQKGWGASRENLKAKLVCERLTGVPQETYSNAAMAWGVEHEAEAREAYQRHMLCSVVEVGFVDHPTVAWAGCSPDGLAGDDGLFEAKCPETKTHINTLLGQSFADKYVKQALWQMACLPERKWVDLVSFDPRLPETMRLFVQRVPRDDAAIAELEREVTAFLSEVDDTVAQLRARYEAGLGDTLNASLEAAA